jgi:hypothetical protein
MSTDSPRYEYTIRRKILTILGAKFHIYNDTGELIGFSRQKAFKLKEDIRVFTDESENAPLISIKARSIIDFSAAYDVVDEKTGNSLGALRRKGFSSILRDSWEVLNQNDEPVGRLAEDSMGMAMVRRFVPMGNLFPQKFSLIDGSGAEIANLRTHFNPFVHKMTVAINADSSIHQMVVLAAGILLVAIEGRQKS